MRIEEIEDLKLEQGDLIEFKYRTLNDEEWKRACYYHGIEHIGKPRLYFSTSIRVDKEIGKGEEVFVERISWIRKIDWFL